tara:strand:+ start:625 stop:738 length:114 start_codon:yes stop_codon:yes gene_type:complete
MVLNTLQTYKEVMEFQLEESRLYKAIERIQQQKNSLG